MRSYEIKRFLWREYYRGTLKSKKRFRERESKMKKKYPDLFPNLGMNLNLENEIFIKRRECKPMA